MERPRSCGNSKKSNDEVVYNAAFHPQSNDGLIYIRIDRLTGLPVKVLQDTGCAGMIGNRALIPDLMVIPGSSGSLQMVDHILIDVPLAYVYLDSLYYKGQFKVMCVSSSVYPVIIDNVRGTRQMLPDPNWKAEDQREAQARTSGGNNDDNDNQGGDMPRLMFREESDRGKTKNQDSKRKPAQIKKNGNRATEDIKVQEDTTEGKCVAGPVLTRAQAKKSDKIHQAMSSVDKTSMEDLQKKGSSLKKCFDRVENRLLERTMLESST